MSIYKVTNDSPLEILTRDAPTLLWILEYDKSLKKITKDLLGINHGDWKIPRRGFYFDGNLYWLNVPEKNLYQQERPNILIREFDKIPFSAEYAFDGNPQDILNAFLKLGYNLIKDDGILIRSG